MRGNAVYVNLLKYVGDVGREHIILLVIILRKIPIVITSPEKRSNFILTKETGIVKIFSTHQLRVLITI